MPYFPIRNDITRMKTDAIVNAANRSLLGGGGVDGAIHAAAGPELLEECRTLGGCETGEAKLTKGYNLPAKYVIHTVGPVYHDGKHGEEALLRNCYRSSLALAKENKLESVAFPLISAGVYGYPPAEAVRVAEEEILSFLRDNDMTVYLVFFNKTAFLAGRERYGEIEELISSVSVMRAEQEDRRFRGNRDAYKLNLSRLEEEADMAPCAPCEEKAAPKKRVSPKVYVAPVYDGGMPTSLMNRLRERDESFQEMLFRCIDERGMTDAECYHRANIDRKLFSKIRSGKNYKPSKPTVAALAVGLKLSLPETKELLDKAGYSLNRCDTFDIIVSYFIEKGNYDVFTINNVLFEKDQQCLGSAGL